MCLKEDMSEGWRARGGSEKYRGGKWESRSGCGEDRSVEWELRGGVYWHIA